MYISKEQIALEKIDVDFKNLVKEADDFAKSTLENTSAMDKLHSLEAQEPTYRSKGLKIKNGVLEGSTATNEIIFIPQGVVEIEKDAFKNRDRGTSKIIFPEGLRKIGVSAFEGCPNILYMDVKEPELCYYADISSDDEIDQFSRGYSRFPSTLEEISDHAFHSFGNNSHGFGENLMEYLILSKTLKKIGVGAFEDSGIRAIYVNGPQYISERCFQGSGLRKAILGDNIIRIEKIAFGSCSRLEKLVFGRKIKEIGDFAFDFCLALKELKFPDSLKKIGKAAFIECGRLGEIAIPDNVTEIGENAFSKCKSLEKAILGKGITFIPECCFSNCGSLKEVIIPDNVTEIANNAFKNCGEFTIFSTAGSYAEQYAKENNIKFQSI